MHTHTYNLRIQGQGTHQLSRFLFLIAVMIAFIMLATNAMAEPAQWVCTQVSHESFAGMKHRIDTSQHPTETFIVDIQSHTINGRNVNSYPPGFLNWQDNTGPGLTISYLFDLKKSIYKRTQTFAAPAEAGGHTEVYNFNCVVPVISVVRP